MESKNILRKLVKKQLAPYPLVSYYLAISVYKRHKILTHYDCWKQHSLQHDELTRHKIHRILAPLNANIKGVAMESRAANTKVGIN